jgi:hypothetical protein
MTTSYYPDYKPKNAEKFSQMEKMLSNAENVTALKQLSLMFIFDMSFDREDIMVAIGRVERANGWTI